MFTGKMVTPATPERVYTLCKIVEKAPLTVADARSKMEPEYLLGSATAYFQDYRSAAEELKLITTIDNTLSFSRDKKDISSITAMRRYINGVLSEFQDGQFYKVTHEYFTLGTEIFKGETNVALLAPLMASRTGMNVDAMAMRGWRFWVSFLGFGYLQDMFFIPNADVFIKDVISIAGLERNRLYSFGEFVDAITPYAAIILGNDRELNYGLSNALRTLHDVGVIKLEHIMDSDDIWNLYPMKAHTITSTVTNITICK